MTIALDGYGIGSVGPAAKGAADLVGAIQELSTGGDHWSIRDGGLPQW